jgi:hypothetical protein
MPFPMASEAVDSMSTSSYHMVCVKIVETAVDQVSRNWMTGRGRWCGSDHLSSSLAAIDQLPSLITRVPLAWEWCLRATVTAIVRQGAA